ncbi:restriction endonuclease subunit S [Vibrio cholerae]
MNRLAHKAGWRELRLSDVIKVKSGDSLSKSKMEDGEFPVFGGNGVSGYHSTYNTDETKIVIGRVGEYCGAVHKTPQYSWITDNALYIHEKKVDINDEYLFFLLDYLALNKYANRNAQPLVSGKTLEQIACTLPSCLIEQQKIAEVLSTVDKKIDLIDQKIAETEKLKTGLMQKLFSEGVGVQDENGDWQPHTEFQKTPIGYLPEQWSIKSLEDVCKVKGGKRLPKGETLISEKNEHPYIRVSDMFMGGVALNDIQYVPEHVVDKIKNYTIGKNDLFISVAGTLGIVGKVPEQLDGANLTENADKLTDIKCNIDYMYYYLCSEKIQSTIDKLKTVGAQPKLALTRIKQFTFIEPSPKEQQKIATILSSVDQKLELLRTQKSETQQLKKGLMQKLLTGEWRIPVEETEAA